MLGLVPMPVLAGIPFHASWKLLVPEACRAMGRTDRAEAVVMALTTLVVVTTNLLEGVLVGLFVAVVLHHLDHACRSQVQEWVRQPLTTGDVDVRLLMLSATAEPGRTGSPEPRGPPAITA